ncbi:MAG: hypothetical protein KA146_02015 [Leptospiraceae bacterium]|nr:hypothetical protein [Leptospiraceae bacterium]
MDTIQHYETLNFNNLYNSINYIEDIPEFGGVYFWIYSPNLEMYINNFDEFRLSLLKFTKVNLSFSEKFYKFKYAIDVKEFIFPDKGTILGLDSNKENDLLDFLQDLENRKYFAKYIKEISFMRPFYIGKAKNIRKRLANHFSQVASSILTELDKQEISYHDIYIGYRQIERVSENEKLNGIFEEIAQRMLKPGLTIRPG